MTSVLGTAHKVIGVNADACVQIERTVDLSAVHIRASRAKEVVVFNEVARARTGEVTPRVGPLEQGERSGEEGEDGGRVHWLGSIR